MWNLEFGNILAIRRSGNWLHVRVKSMLSLLHIILTHEAIACFHVLVHSTDISNYHLLKLDSFPCDIVE